MSHQQASVRPGLPSEQGTRGQGTMGDECMFCRNDICHNLFLDLFFEQVWVANDDREVEGVWENWFSNQVHISLL